MSSVKKPFHVTHRYCAWLAKEQAHYPLLNLGLLLLHLAAAVQAALSTRLLPHLIPIYITSSSSMFSTHYGEQQGGPLVCPCSLVSQTKQMNSQWSRHRYSAA